MTRVTKKGLLFGLLAVQVLLGTTLGSLATYALEYNKAPQRLIPNTLTYQQKKFPLVTDRSLAKLDLWLKDQSVSSGFQVAKILQVLGNGNDVFSAMVPREERLDRAEIIPQLQRLALQTDRKPVEATLKFDGQRLIRQNEQSGYRLDVDGTYSLLLQDVSGQPVSVQVKKLRARPGADDLTQVKDILGDYTTYFNPQDVARTTNINRAAKALDGTLVAPGTVFSFNGTVGERSGSSGYLPALVYADQSKTRQDGGGVCQDSTTLYQTVLQAHLPIVERHRHSLPVNYVAGGQDATVAYGVLDFRFRNDTAGYLMISARTGSNFIRIKLFGIADKNHPVTRAQQYFFQAGSQINFK
ncbi:MAG TPA: VanW family protein [Desulfobacteria bacterium]|nr:VanW family protein [Desulfobacteria bacterium]